MMLADLESIQKRLEKNNKKNVDEDQLKILEMVLLKTKVVCRL